MDKPKSRVILGHNLRAISQLARAEKDVNVTCATKELRYLLKNFPRLAGAGAGQGFCGIRKDIKGLGWLAQRSKREIAMALQSLVQYCIKHNLGLLVESNLDTLEIFIAWEKPLPGSRPYEVDSLEWLVPYSTVG